MIISVTDTHIQNGKPNSYEKCPIALAVREQLDNSYEVLVYYDRVVTYQRASRRRYVMPDIGRQFVEAFDEGLPVQPIEFTVEES